MANILTVWWFLVASLIPSHRYGGHLVSAEAAVSLEVRDTALCGVDHGSCPSGQCCNSKGECGTSHAFCGGARNCQMAYSDYCEAQKMPSGESLLDLPRPVLGTVPYGKLIQGCTKKGSIAIAFDDGPATNFTSKILDLLASYNMRASFFVTGHNFAKAIDDPTVGYAPMLNRMHSEGHQIGHHTWTHENMTLLNETQRVDQIHYNEMALRNVLGFIPTYFRPPYLQCLTDCQELMAKMGYHVIMKNLDTLDFDNNSPDLIQTSKDIFVANMKNVTASNVVYITLNHDIRMETAYNLTDFMLNYLVANNFPKSVTVGECLEDPAENWYRKTPTGPIPGLNASASKTSSKSGGASKKSGSSKLQAGNTVHAAMSVFGAMIPLLLWV